MNIKGKEEISARISNFRHKIGWGHLGYIHFKLYRTMENLQLPKRHRAILFHPYRTLKIWCVC